MLTELEFFSLVEELGPAGATDAAEEEIPAAEEAVTSEAWADRAGRLAGGEIFVALLGDERPLGLAVAAAGEGPVLYADFRRDGVRDAVLASSEGVDRQLRRSASPATTSRRCSASAPSPPAPRTSRTPC